MHILLTDSHDTVKTRDYDTAQLIIVFNGKNSK